MKQKHISSRLRSFEQVDLSYNGLNIMIKLYEYNILLCVYVTINIFS